MIHGDKEKNIEGGSRFWIPIQVGRLQRVGYFFFVYFWLRTQGAFGYLRVYNASEDRA